MKDSLLMWAYLLRRKLANFISGGDLQMYSDLYDANATMRASQTVLLCRRSTKIQSKLLENSTIQNFVLPKISTLIVCSNFLQIGNESMKYTIALMALFALTACKDERPVSESVSGRDYRVECIDGVEYWTRSIGNKGFMAVRVDPETMTFVRCKGN